MNSILITGIGGDLAQGVAKVLSESYPEVTLYGSDIHNRHGGAVLVDKVVQVPPAGDGYLTAIREVMQAESIEGYLPLTEPEIRCSQPLIRELGSKRYIGPGALAASVGLDKQMTMNFLSDIGIEVPWTSSTKEGYPQEYPCVLKNRFGSGSRGVEIVKNSEEAAFYISSKPDSIFQELLEPEDREISCAVYRSKSGQVGTLILLRRLSGGVTTWAQVIEDDAIESLCGLIAEKLELRGSMNIQMKNTLDGPRIFEINPRLSSTALMRHRLGFTDVVWTVQEIRGETIDDFPLIPVGAIIIRTHDSVILQ